MTLFERVHMPAFAGATGWLNSEPLGPAELRGRVVLVNFWTLTCINWFESGTPLLERGLIDEVDLHVLPRLLGDGTA